MTIHFDDSYLNAPSNETSAIRIYWDSQDPQNEGPAWKSSSGSGPLDLVGWSDGAVDGDGRCVSDYFGADGYYIGPDCDGVYPILA